MKYFIILASCFAACCKAQKLPTSAEYDGIIGGYEYVDLGLPSRTLWASYNVGATSPYENGYYFAWGEIEPREDFTWENYSMFLGYDSRPGEGAWRVLEDIGTDICGTVYDAARQLWGNGWRMPTEREANELNTKCWSKYVVENGIRGVRIHGPNEHTIFLPTCGYGLWYGEDMAYHYAGEGGYWCGYDVPDNLFSGYPIEPSPFGGMLLVDSGGMDRTKGVKASGHAIRAVINRKEIASAVDAVGCDVAFSYRDGYIVCSGVDTSKYRITLCSSSGRTILSGRLDGKSFKLPPLVKGVYVVSLSDGNTVVKTQKVTFK